MGKDSGIEIKVVNPRKGDNVVHPVGPGQPTSASKPSNSSPVPDERRRPQQDRRARELQGMTELKPFKKWVTWMVPGFVLVNIVVFIISMFINNCPKNSASCFAPFLGRFSFQPFKENPLLGPSSSTLEKMGALEVSKIAQGHQAWRLITCIWLHAGVFHILANMLSLVFIGIRLEQEFGFVRIGLLYVIAGFGGSLMSSLFIQTGISVGASVSSIVDSPPNYCDKSFSGNPPTRG
ncbi:Peptidase S54, rhomboid [Corchorus olitorius]|uniref:RHOMBOID-like protein n=1 Tax=Corchorus olitorius TaxID=93759 RepID=A0A1R3J8V4_9ROSI|nr:Peptidase S54, rhomboid [Corchorus olitorius]